MADKRKIVIDLNNSLYAHGFESEQQIHKEDLDKTISIIRNQLQQTDMQEDQNVFLTHLYRTIGIFGDRGSGKTSFMISLLNQCKNELKDDVEVLRMIDPTLVEHKKPIILCVISMITAESGSSPTFKRMFNHRYIRTKKSMGQGYDPDLKGNIRY